MNIPSTKLGIQRKFRKNTRSEKNSKLWGLLGLWGLIGFIGWFSSVALVYEFISPKICNETKWYLLVPTFITTRREILSHINIYCIIITFFYVFQKSNQKMLLKLYFYCNCNGWHYFKMLQLLMYVGLFHLSIDVKMNSFTDLIKIMKF